MTATNQQPGVRGAEETLVDLLVIGAGMAGLSAAARTVQAGGAVAVVEKGEVGGSAQFAAYIWTAPTIEVLREENPDGDPDLGARLVSAYEPAMEWVRTFGVEIGPVVHNLRFGIGHRVDVAGLLKAFEELVRQDGRSEILVGAEPEQLLIEDGVVLGARIRLASGDTRMICARATLLASGGFAGDPELRSRYLHAQAGDVPLRANPYSSGDGLRLGLSAGGQFGADQAGFYGHLMPAGLHVEPILIPDYSFYHSEHGVLVNLDGKRFIDETRGDHHSAMALMQQPEARALLITDERVHREWMMQPYVPGIEPIDKFRLAYRKGARCATAQDIEEFLSLPDDWGYPGAIVSETLTTFDEQCKAGTPDPPRAWDTEPLDDPPYYIIEVVPGVTFPLGGLVIDDESRVLDKEGQPIRGLLAAGGDIGGLHVRAYAGGLAPALIFGLQAAETARISPRTAARGASGDGKRDG